MEHVETEQRIISLKREGVERGRQRKSRDDPVCVNMHNGELGEREAKEKAEEKEEQKRRGKKGNDDHRDPETAQ